VLQHDRMPLRILLVCPAAPGSLSGNRVTAIRWTRILRSLGHRVRIASDYDDAPTDLLVALHARWSAKATRAFRRTHPTRPLVLALTGTDLYHDMKQRRAARVALSLTLADRLIVLQPRAVSALPPRLRSRARVIYQSAESPRRRPRPSGRHFDVCVLSHLRPVKDPLRPAIAARALPADSRIRIVHAGRALSRAMAARARAEAARNPRYRWLGELSRGRARRLLARSRLLVLPSRLEGGANVIGEAAVCGVPVLATRVDGSVGLLGRRYPGFFPVDDTVALRRLLRRAETEQRFLIRLERAVRQRASAFRPANERRAWRRLLTELRRCGQGSG
jgi:putative glycosyltransferase (TIGR04348 family)